uniref:Uncharacterized protein n=1 Tax=Anguilla anguilla TaxID=7936 RepID=A0A0E9PI66_ANGAN
MSPKSIQCSLLRLKRCLFEKLKRRGRKGSQERQICFWLLLRCFQMLVVGAGVEEGCT